MSAGKGIEAGNVARGTQAAVGPAPVARRAAAVWRRRLPSAAGLRLGSGLVLFAYATMHLLNHTLGNISLEALGAGADIKEFVWSNPVGLAVLYGAFLVHLGLVVAKTLNRRVWRLPGWQVVQIASGLAVPALLLPHILATRGAETLLGTEVGYRKLLTLVWSGDVPLQTLLLVVVWLHGCIGLHFWLRLKPWYRGAAPFLGWAAVALLALSFSGFVSAARMVEIENAPRRFFPPAALQMLGPWVGNVRIASLLAVAALGAAVVLRPLFKRLRGEFRVTYDGHRSVRAHPGRTLLEISREAGIAHASACGGRARCSTCRVQIVAGLDRLAPPGPAEARLLDRIEAPGDVRLACQTRPRADVTLRLLVGAGEIYDPAAAVDPYRWGVEREVAVMFADLRGFTRLTENRLAYDVVHLLNAYFDRAARAVADHGGTVDKFMGDGMMALFAVDVPLAEGSRRSIAAARDLLSIIDTMNAELADELEDPLRLAIGLHCGPAILGRIGGGLAARAAFTALGDTVNTAARLEDVAKANDAALCISQALAVAARLGPDAGQAMTSDIRGRREAVAVRLFADGAAVEAALAPAELAPPQTLPERRPRPDHMPAPG